MRNFLTALTVCHTVVCDNEEGKEVAYQAQSPDELALILGAKELGAKLVGRNSKEFRVYNELEKEEEAF